MQQKPEVCTAIAALQESIFRLNAIIADMPKPGTDENALVSALKDAGDTAINVALNALDTLKNCGIKGTGEPDAAFRHLKSGALNPREAA